MHVLFDPLDRIVEQTPWPEIGNKKSLSRYPREEKSWLFVEPFVLCVLTLDQPFFSINSF